LKLDRSENDGNATRSHREALVLQKAETRRRILDAARKVFLRAGYLDANLNEVAREAGVGKGTLYRHFENKAELYLAMLSEHGEAFTRELAGAVDRDGPVAKQLEQLAYFYLDFWERHPDHFQIIWAMHNRHLIGPISDELTARVTRLFEAPVQLIAALIRRGIESGELREVDPWDAANALAVSATAVIRPLVSGSPSLVDRDERAVYRQLIDLLVAGLRSEGAER